MKSTTVSHRTRQSRRPRLRLLAGAIACMLGVSATHMAVAQTEAKLFDDLRAAESVSYRQAALAALAAAGRADLGSMSSADTQTLDSLVLDNIPLRSVDLEQSISTAQFAFLVMEAFPIPEGVMYRLFPSPRYALRDLRFYDILPNELEARDHLDGETALSLLSRTRAWVTRHGGPEQGGRS